MWRDSQAHQRTTKGRTSKAQSHAITHVKDVIVKKNLFISVVRQQTQRDRKMIAPDRDRSS